MADVTTVSKQTEGSRKTAVRRKCVSSRLQRFVGFRAGEVKPEHISCLLRISISMNPHVTVGHHLNCRAPGGIVNSEQTCFDMFQGIFFQNERIEMCQNLSN